MLPMAEHTPDDADARDRPGREGMTYAAAGVDIDAGDAVVDRIREQVQRTFGPRVIGRHGGFAGLLRLDYNERLFARNFREPVLVACTDGVGTKVLLAKALGRHNTIGQDLVAMNVNDMIVQGAEPLLFLDYIGIHKVEPELIAAIIEGIAEGCRLAGCALLGGETAEMPDLYAGGDYDLAGFAVGVCELGKVIDGRRISPGDVVIGLASSGVHSNGYSLVRAIIRDRKLDLERPYGELETDRTLGEVLLEPTRIYVRPVLSLLNRYKVKQPVLGMAHITGGGLPGNVNRVLPSNVDARIERSAWPVPPVFGFLQAQGQVDEAEMLRVFNMGIGYVLIVRPHFADSMLEQLRRAGEQPRILGRTVAGTGKVLFA